jgi:hypothetical protein
MRTIQMQRGLLLSLLSLVIPITAQAQTIAIGKYQTTETFDKAFLAALRTTPLAKFTVKSSDKEQGTIQAIQSTGGQEFASLFLMIRREGSNVIIEGTFTRNPGFIGGGKPEAWAQKFGDELKSNLPDLTISVTKQKK